MRYFATYIGPHKETKMNMCGIFKREVPQEITEEQYKILASSNQFMIAMDEVKEVVIVPEAEDEPKKKSRKKKIETMEDSTDGNI